MISAFIAMLTLPTTNGLPTATDRWPPRCHVPGMNMTKETFHMANMANMATGAWR